MSNLKSCPDCSHKVSPKAASCPKCGRANPGGVSVGYRIAQAIVVLGGVLFSLGLCAKVLNSAPLPDNAEALREAVEAAK